MPTRCRSFVAGVVLAAALAGCASQDSNAPSAPPSPAGPVILNDVSVAEILAAIDKAKLPAVNPHDATATTCPAAGCVQATDTDTVSILKFPSTGRAELYAASMPDMVQAEDVVLVFAPTVTDEQKSAYRRVVKGAVAGS